MADYFITDEVAGDRINLIDTRGRAYVLRYVSMFGTYLLDATAANYYNAGVQFWRPNDQMRWFDLYKWASIEVMNSIRGVAFPGSALDQARFALLPQAQTYNNTPFALYGWVFVPYGATDPRIEQVTPGPAPPGGAPPEPSWGDENGADEDEVVTEEPVPERRLPGMIRVGLAIAVGGVFAFVSWRLTR